jgi:hypothetical protein
MYTIMTVVIVGALMGLLMFSTAVKSSEDDKHYKELVKGLKSLKFYKDDDDVTGEPMGPLFARILNQTLCCHDRDLATYLQAWQELEKSREWYGDNQYAITVSQNEYQQHVGHKVVQGMLDLVASDSVLV